jgi:O-antigen/teichoic acid export membrane protein
MVTYFTRGAKRTVKLKRNVAISFVLRGVNVLAGFALVPLTINYVNPTRYGIWITLTSIIAWFSFFDIGLGHGLRNKFAEAVALGKHKLAKVYVSTTYAILAIVTGAAMIVFLAVNPFLEWTAILNTTSEMSRELTIVALIVFVFFCIQFVLQLVNVVLTANQEPAKAATFKLIANLISLLTVFVIARTTSGDLVKLAVALGAAPLIALAGASIWFYSGAYSRYAPSYRHVHFRLAPQLMKLGVKFFVIQVSGIVIFSTDNVIITQLFGPTEVTPYSLAFKYFSSVTVIFSIIVSPFWSAITEAYVKADMQWIRRSMTGMLRAAGILSLLAIAMVAFAEPAYRLWVGESIQIPWTLNILMCAYFCINLFTQPFTFFINGTGKVQLQLIQSVVMALLNVPLALSLAGSTSLGINGIILAVIVASIPGLILSSIQYRKITGNTATGIWNR